jgi:anti-sigma regulatory factor (Ser/Thr protein kinase)/FixJ family two-component response regulator
METATQEAAARAQGRAGSADELRILVLAPTGRDAPLAAGALEAAGLRASACGSMEELTRAFAEGGAGAAVVALEALTPPALDLLGRTLAQQPPWSDLPLVVLTGSGRATEAAEALLQDSDRLGNATFLERPLRVATLVRAVRVALRARARQYEIRGHLLEREHAAAERVALLDQQRAFLRDVLTSVTEGRLRLCDSEADLPAPLDACSEPIPLARETLARLRAEARRAARAARLGHDRMSDLLTAVTEAGMNAVTHAGGGTGRVCADPARHTVQAWIEDRGGGIDVARIPKATLERGYSSAGTLGHGFWLMLQTCDRTYLLTGPNGTTVVVEQGAAPPEPAWMRHVLAYASAAGHPAGGGQD